jgi:hypothetical protein
MWMKNCGIDPDNLPQQSAAELDAANNEHDKFGEMIDKAYSEVYIE